MATVAERLLEAVRRHPGETDRYYTDILFDKNRHQAQVNQEARLLESGGQLLRRKREDGRIGNYPVTPSSRFTQTWKKGLQLVKSFTQRKPAS